MPGVQRGLLPLALLTLRVRHHRPAPTDEGIDWGPYDHWVRPLVLLARGLRADAAVALQQIPEPPPDHLFEALWCLTARAAIALDDRDTMRRAYVVLAPAAAEHAGAGSGMLSLGPVSGLLDELT
jgi:hypothetical protein